VLEFLLCFASATWAAAGRWPGGDEDETAETAGRPWSACSRFHGAHAGAEMNNGRPSRPRSAKALAEHGVLVLHSPGYTSSYNGSGGGGVGVRCKTGTENTRSGRASGVWDRRGRGAAQLEANAFAASPADSKRSPEQVWQVREPLQTDEREALAAK